MTDGINSSEANVLQRIDRTNGRSMLGDFVAANDLAVHALIERGLLTFRSRLDGKATGVIILTTEGALKMNAWNASWGHATP